MCECACYRMEAVRSKLNFLVWSTQHLSLITIHHPSRTPHLSLSLARPCSRVPASPQVITVTVKSIELALRHFEHVRLENERAHRFISQMRDVRALVYGTSERNATRQVACIRTCLWLCVCVYQNAEWRVRERKRDCVSVSPSIFKNAG